MDRSDQSISEAPIYALIPAAGSGSRLCGALPKQYLPLQAGRSMLECSARVLLCNDWIKQVLVVVSPGDELFEPVAAALKAEFSGRIEFVKLGGATRRDTVLAGLLFLQRSLAEFVSPWVMVHDAARPGLDQASLQRLRSAVTSDPLFQGGLLALPIADTVKLAMQGTEGTASVKRSQETLDRNKLWVAQTPQMFGLAKLIEALEIAKDVTDEASAIEQLGLQPLLVAGSARNFKVTTQDDLLVMCSLLALAST